MRQACHESPDQGLKAFPLPSDIDRLLFLVHFQLLYTVVAGCPGRIHLGGNWGTAATLDLVNLPTETVPSLTEYFLLT